MIAVDFGGIMSTMNNYDRFRFSTNLYAAGPDAQPRYETNGSFLPEWRVHPQPSQSAAPGATACSDWRSESRSLETEANWRKASTGSDHSSRYSADKPQQPRKPKIKNKKKRNDDDGTDEFVMLTAKGAIDYDYVYTGVAATGSYEVRRCDLPKELC